MSEPPGQPAISVVILNYNGLKWLQRCLESLRGQTIFPQLEVVIADNASSDGSDRMSERLLAGWSNGRFIQNGENLGFCEGNNRGARAATGKYLFFLNNDTWLEPDCLENLLKGVEAEQAGAGGPLVLDYGDNQFQSIGSTGIDWLGCPDRADVPAQTSEQFVATGCAYMIRAELFNLIGGFDSRFFLYSEEADLSWRVWIAGQRLVVVPSARLHHRGAVDVNPQGGTKATESRTSYSKRYYANRNGLLFLAINAQHILLLLVLPHLLLLVGEGFAALLLTRDWTFVKKAYLQAMMDVWRMRDHVQERRRQIRAFRRRSDFFMLRFLRLKPSRWGEVARLFQAGVPKVDAR